MNFAQLCFPSASTMYTPAVVLFLATLSTAAPQHTVTDKPDVVPGKTAQGHTGTNECGTTSSQDSMF